MAVAQAPRRSALALAGFGVLLAYPSWAFAVSSMHRRKVERALRDSETTYRNLIEMAPDAVLIVDGAGRIILINSQAEQVFGYSRDELIGRPVEALLPTELRADHEQHRRRFQSNPATRPMGTDLDIRGLRKDGTEIPLEISLSPWQEGSQAGVMAIARDVSLQRSSEREIRRLNGDLQLQTQELLAVNRELEAFSYSVSHDLRAPLRAIDGFSQALIEDYGERLGEKAKDYLQRVRGGAQRMSALIDDLLKLSRITRSELHRTDVDLARLAIEVVTELRRLDPQRNVEVEIPDALHVYGDAQLLLVALENLLANAWKFTGNAAEPRIELGRASDDPELVVFVRDNGAGFDMTYSNKLFGAFQRLHSHREFPGTGIGLATVQRVVHKHGGRVWAEGKLGHGATFYFSLGEEPSS